MILEHDDTKDLEEDLLEVAKYIPETFILDDFDNDCDEFDSSITNLLNIFENECISEHTSAMK